MGGGGGGDFDTWPMDYEFHRLLGLVAALPSAVSSTDTGPSAGPQLDSLYGGTSTAHSHSFGHFGCFMLFTLHLTLFLFTVCS